MAITSLAGRYLQDSFKFVTQNSQSAVSPDKWIFADGEGVPITWIDVTASWAASASVAVGLVDNIWVRSTGSNSAVLNDSGSRISVAYGTSSIAYGHRTTASGDFSQAQGSSSWAYGTGSHAGGLHTIACGSYQTVVGRFNKPNNDSDYFVIGDGTTNANRSDALGVNATRFFASNSIYFPDLADQRYQHIVMFNTESGQINYYTASGLGGGGTTLPGGPHGAIQFNSASTFSGSNYFVYNYQNSQLGLTGSQVIDLSGSSTALQIINDCDGQSAILTNLPFLPNNWFRIRPLVYVPSSSADPNIKGQLWFIHEDTDGRPRPAQVFEVTSSNGDLRFKGYIGSSSGTPPALQGINGRLTPPVIRAANFSGRGRILVGDRYSNGLIAYNPDKVASQPSGFAYKYPSAEDTALYEYISPLTGSDGNGLVAKRYTANPNNITYTPNGVAQYYSVFNIAVSKSNAGYNTDISTDALRAGTYLSKSINDLYNAGLPITGAANNFPLGFFMSTFDNTVATNTQYVDLTTPLLNAGLPQHRIFSGSIIINSLGRRVMAELPYIYGSYTVAGEYNADLNRIYVVVNFGGGLHPYVGFVELDNTTTPPSLIGYVTSSAGLIYHTNFTYNSNTKDLLVRDEFYTKYKVYDANGNINWASPKATITMPSDFVGGQLTGFQFGTPIASGNDFYLAGGKPTPSGQALYSIIFESQSTGYVVKTGSLAENWETALPLGTRKANHGTTPIVFGSNINKFFVGNNSEIGPVGNPDTADETALYKAKSNKIYSFSSVAGSPTSFTTPSQIVFNPYTYDVNRIGNFVEFVDCNGETLSYVDANGIFQGTASFASNVLPGGSSIEFYSGSVLQTSNLEGLRITGSYLQSEVNGNQVTMSIDLSSILATFTSQSFTTPATSWTFNHNLNERHPLITVYDNNHEVIIPQDVIANNNNTVTINFSANTTGYAVAGAGPFTGLTRYPISFYSSSVLQTSDLRSLVISGSGVTSTLNGNQITMSFSGGGGGTANPGGANTNIQFNYNGNSLSGSGTFTFISQSSTVLLTGSLIITGSGSSPSLNVTGTSLLTGSLNLSGSATITSGTITAITPVVGGEGFIGTASWATNASNVTVTGDTSFDRDWNLTFTRYTGVPTAVENRNLYADPQLEYNTKYNQLLINATGSKINQQTGSNIAVNNIQPAGNSIQIGSSRSGSVYYVNLSSSLYNNNVYGLIMNYTITADHTLVNNHNAEDHNEDPNTGGIPYVETGTITVTWTGRDSDYNISTATFDTDPAAYYTIVTPLPTEWRLQSGTTYGEIDADELYSYAPKYTTYRHDTDLQFGYKLVNNNSPSGVTTGEWYFEIMLWNALPARVEFISNTNLLTYNQSL